MRARDLMTRDVVTVPPDTPVPALARLLAERGVSSAPVVEADGRLVGIVTEADLLRRVAALGERPKGWLARLFADPSAQAARYAKGHGARARDVMTTDLITVEEDARAEEIARLLEEHRIKRVPVLRDGRLAGVVSRADLLRAVLESPETLAADAPDARIQRDLAAALRGQPWAHTFYIFPSVQDGVVTFYGWCSSEEVGRGLRVLAEGVPGVKGVQDETTPPPPHALGWA
jgi:CBS domain-containing protein